MPQVGLSPKIHLLPNLISFLASKVCPIKVMHNLYINLEEPFRLMIVKNVHSFVFNTTKLLYHNIRASSLWVAHSEKFLQAMLLICPIVKVASLHPSSGSNFARWHLGQTKFGSDVVSLLGCTAKQL